MPRVIRKNKSADDFVTIGSGNVFEDLGLPQPAEALRKAELVRRIGEAIQANGWTQAKTAQVLGVDQPKISALLRGRLEAFSLERLIRFLERLDQDVILVVRARATPPHTNGRVNHQSKRKSAIVKKRNLAGRST